MFYSTVIGLGWYVVPTVVSSRLEPYLRDSIVPHVSDNALSRMVLLLFQGAILRSAVWGNNFRRMTAAAFCFMSAVAYMYSFDTKYSVSQLREVLLSGILAVFFPKVTGTQMLGDEDQLVRAAYAMLISGYFSSLAPSRQSDSPAPIDPIDRALNSMNAHLSHLRNKAAVVASGIEELNCIMQDIRDTISTYNASGEVLSTAKGRKIFAALKKVSKNELEQLRSDIGAEFVCPITLEIMREPVEYKGKHYEHSVLKIWYQKSPTRGPVDSEPLSDPSTLSVDEAMQDRILSALHALNTNHLTPSFGP